MNSLEFTAGYPGYINPLLQACFPLCNKGLLHLKRRLPPTPAQPPVVVKEGFRASKVQGGRLLFHWGVEVSLDRDAAGWAGRVGTWTGTR